MGNRLNNRRRYVLALAAGVLAKPLGPFAQPTRRIVRIGVLVPGSRAFFMNRFDAFVGGLKALGYVEGKNLAFEYRYADGKSERLPALAQELVTSKVDLIFSAGPESINAAKNATSIIPIVFGSLPDPVASGIVTSLARPGANVTGLSTLASDLGQKRLELLKELAPKAQRIAFLWGSAAPGASVNLKEVQAAAKALGLRVQSLEVRNTQDLVMALEAARREGVQALLTNPDPAVNAEQAHIVAFAALHRLPAIYAAPEAMELGGLMTYAPNYADLWRRAAVFVDKILKGSKPSEIPVEQPIKFELVVNLKTAKAIGVTIPQTILMRADRLIE